MKNFFVGPILKIRVLFFLKRLKKWAKKVNLEGLDDFLTGYGTFLDAERNNKRDHTLKIAKICLSMRNVKRYYAACQKERDIVKNIMGL